jgi:hypothetical protein
MISSRDVRPPAPGNPSPAGGCEPAQRRRDVRASVLLALACLLVYNANLRTIGAGDTLPARYLPFGIWRYGSVLLDPIREMASEGNANPYWIVDGRAGHSLSLYPVVLPVLIAPLYLPAVAYLDLRGWTEWRLRRAAVVMEKLTSSLLAAAAAALLYLLLRRRAPPADALLLALAFAFGTNTWMTGSQALWQHGLAELLLVGALLLLTGPCTTSRALAAGALCGLIAGNRPPDVLLAAALGLYGLRWAGRRAGWLAAGAAAPLGLVLAYNVAAAGNLAGGYGLPDHPAFFHHGLLSGLAGLLFSPTRGLLVFSPFLLLVPAALRHGLRDRGARALTLALGVAALVQMLFYAKADWRAGFSWGPRWLTDLMPLLVWMLPPGLAALRAAGRLAFVLAAGASMAVQAVGAFWYTGASDMAIFAVPPGPGQMSAAWDPRNTPFFAELRHDLASPDPAFTRWKGAAAARVPDSAAALPAARREITVVASRTEPGGAHSPPSRDQDAELGAAAQDAAALLRSHQQPAGSWLTSHTVAPRFEDPRQEMNTFLTAMVIDLLDPVAAAAGVGESLARARAHLAGQIEPSGLVRYHGRPDGSTIPSLGCAITPDADDTSLVWRLAGSGRRELLPRALAILAQYRTREGLYRTWLAPRERYECIDPGKDPNPTDAGIQMHVFLLLAQAEPPAARTLCGALRGALGEDRLWVYYQMAPLVPLLRQADLRLAGCPLRFAETRLRTPVGGQEVWLAAGRLLDRLRSADGPAPPPAETLAVLRSLAKDGFSVVRRTPPLLYHNDLTAGVSRYYWSEDFGYALWLRLYLENARRKGGTTAVP